MGIPVGLIETEGANGAIAAFDAVVKATNIRAHQINAYTMEGDRILLTFEGRESFLGEIETAVEHAVHAIEHVQGSNLISAHTLSNIEEVNWDRIEDALGRFTSPYGRVLVDAIEHDFSGGVAIPPPINAGATTTAQEIVFPGAEVNDWIGVRAPRAPLDPSLPTPPVVLEVGLHAFAYVTAPDTVTLRVYNGTGGQLSTPQNMIYRLILTKY